MDGEYDPRAIRPLAVARYMDELKGGTHGGGGPEAEAACRVRALWPGIREQLLAVDWFHVRAAVWAMSGCVIDGEPWPAASAVIFAAGLYPPSAMLLPGCRPGEDYPGARFGFACADPGLAALWQPVADGIPGAAAWAAWADDPAAVLAGADRAGMEGPYSVHLPHALHWWPGGYAEKVIAAWGEALPPGSSLVLSWSVCGGQPAPEITEVASSLAGAPCRTHQPADVEAWIAAAGLQLHPQGITDVQAWPSQPGAGSTQRARSAGGFVEAVALRR